MILPWKRAEIYIGTSVKEFSEIRSLLKTNGIRYDYDVGSHSSWLGGSWGVSRGAGLAPEEFYSIWVEKANLEMARYLVYRSTHSD